MAPVVVPVVGGRHREDVVALAQAQIDERLQAREHAGDVGIDEQIGAGTHRRIAGAVELALLEVHDEVAVEPVEGLGDQGRALGQRRGGIRRELDLDLEALGHAQLAAGGIVAHRLERQRHQAQGIHRARLAELGAGRRGLTRGVPAAINDEAIGAVGLHGQHAEAGEAPLARRHGDQARAHARGQRDEARETGQAGPAVLARDGAVGEGEGLVGGALDAEVLDGEIDQLAVELQPVDAGLAHREHGGLRRRRRAELQREGRGGQGQGSEGEQEAGSSSPHGDPPWLTDARGPGCSVDGGSAPLYPIPGSFG